MRRTLRERGGSRLRLLRQRLSFAGRNVGKVPVKLIVFYAAGKGQALTQKPQP